MKNTQKPKAGRKASESTIKRRIAISKLQDEYPQISQTELIEKLNSVFGIAITRQTMATDLAWLNTHNINTYIADSSKTLLELDIDKVNTEIKYNEDLRARAKLAGDTRTEASVGKLIKDLVSARGKLSKASQELAMSEQSNDRPIINLTIGSPKPIDKAYYKQRQQEIRSKSKFAGRK